MTELSDYMTELALLKTENKKLKSKNKKLKSKNKKLKKELDRAYKQEVKDMNETEPEEDVPEKLTTEELESIVADIISLEYLFWDDGSLFMSEHRPGAQEHIKMEMDKLRLADPALADRVAKAISVEDLFATPSMSEVVKRLVTPL